MANGMQWTRGRLRAAREVAHDVRLLELEPEDGVRPFATGSHLDVEVHIGDAPDVRSYSLVGDAPVDGAYRVAVKRVQNSRGGSRWLWGLEPGARLALSHPASHFELQLGRPEYVLLAGGIGITPIVGMAATLHRRGARFRLLYTARSRAQMAFAQELTERFGDAVELFASEEEGGRLDVARELAALAPDGELYVCGPLRLLDAARLAWREQERSPTALRYETFASGGRHAAEPFVLRLGDLGGREVVVPTDRTALEALQAAGVQVLSDCLRGECGLCVADVLERDGEIDHRDVFLSEEQQREGRTFCTCVSRVAGGTITIDTGFRPDPVRHSG
jgi:vanillate O-demethylase ferredoxin subunit